MKFFETIKRKIQQLSAKIAGKPQIIEPYFAKITIFKNGEEVFIFTSCGNDYGESVCNLISYFNKFNDYKIIYNYVEREINIYFTVKKANDVECTDDGNKNKK